MPAPFLINLMQVLKLCYLNWVANESLYIQLVLVTMHNVQCNQRFLCVGQQTISHYMHASDHEVGGKTDADAEKKEARTML